MPKLFPKKQEHLEIAMRSQSVSHRDKDKRDRLAFIKINTVKKGTEVCNKDRRVGIHPPLYTDSSVVEEINVMTP